MDELSDKDLEIFEGKNFAHLATVMPDGSPQVTPVWVSVEGDQILVNTSEGRVKTNNVRRDPRIALSILDADEPYGRVVQVRGRVKEMIPEGAVEHIDALAKKYLSKDRYPWLQEDETRVILKIEPEYVNHSA